MVERKSSYGHIIGTVPRIVTKLYYVCLHYHCNFWNNDYTICLIAFSKYGYFSAYFVDLRTHEGSQRSWLDQSLLRMPFYSHRLGLPKFNLFSVYKLQLEQLCDFVPLDSWFFFSPLPEPPLRKSFEME